MAILSSPLQLSFGKSNEEEEQLILREMTGKFSKLPLEITFDILSRVPIKTLSQSCRWVSKSWFKILRNPRFAQIQHAKASQIFSPCVSCFDLSSQTFFLVDHQVFDNHEYSTTVHHPNISGFGSKFDIIGSCNGLICMCSDHLSYTPQPYFIFNPITRDYISLPISPLSETVHISSAFGFDPVTNEYKVVRIMRSHEVEIYTLGSGSQGWRTICGIPHHISTYSAFVNGALHWIIYKESERIFGIFALDMATEQFREIPPPPCVFTPRYKLMRNRCVGVLGGCLCFTDDNFYESSEIWVMKSYGIQESWSKEYVLREERSFSGCWGDDGYQVIKLENGKLLLNRNSEGGPGTLQYHQITMLEDGGILLSNKRDLNHKREGTSLQCENGFLDYYDSKRKSFKRIVTHGIPSTVSSSQLKPIFHVGNLISPKNTGRSPISNIKKDDSSKGSLLGSVNVPVASNQVSKSNVEVFADLRSLKYIYNYVYERHDQDTVVLEL